MNIQILRRDRFSSVKNNPYLINKDTLITTDCNFIMIITFQAAGGQRTRTPARMMRAPCSMTRPPSTPRPAASPPRPWRTAPTGWTRPARSGENIQFINTKIFKSNLPGGDVRVEAAGGAGARHPEVRGGASEGDGGHLRSIPQEILSRLRGEPAGEVSFYTNHHSAEKTAGSKTVSSEFKLTADGPFKHE